MSLAASPPKKPTPKPVANKSNLALFYGRISGMDDEREASLDTQVKGGRAQAAKLGAKLLADDIHQEQFTGFELYNRKVLSRVREKIRTGAYKYLIVHAIDRLARRMAYVAIIAEECERYGCELISVTEDFDSSPEGELLRSIKGYVAEVEREKIRERTMRGRDYLINRGKLPCAGWAPYGYTYDYVKKEGGGLALDPPSAEIVKQIFQWVIEGLSARAICRELTKEGVPTPRERRGHRWKDGRACRWGDAVIARMIRNDIYTGAAAVYGKTRCQGRRANGRPNQVPQPPEEWITLEGNRAPRIISDETFRDANARFDSRLIPADRTKNKERPRLLRGIFFCKTCGKRMNCVTNTFKGKHYFYYKCSSGRYAYRGDAGQPCRAKMVPVEWADAAVWEEVCRATADRKTMRAMFEKAMSEINDSSESRDMEALEGTLARLAKLLDTLRAKWSQALASGESEFADVIEQQIRRTTADLSAARSSQAEASARVATRMDQAAMLRRFEEVLDEAEGMMGGEIPFDLKRKRLAAMGVRVVGEGHDLHIEMLPFSAIAERCRCVTLGDGRGTSVVLSLGSIELSGIRFSHQ